jgi:PTH1 family peptidyl-tRNA hydrolase
MSPTKMIVGLGNPGPRYAYNRHNIGFQCLDLLARRHQIDLGRIQLRAAVGDGWVACRDARAKVVGPLVRYYQIAPEDILVIHDDLDLDSGKLRIRRNGSSGGQNGVRSLIQHLGGQEFHRVRVGVGRPPGRMDPAAYVLQDFSSAEEEVFGPLRATVCDAIECWLFEGVESAMNQYNG